MSYFFTHIFFYTDINTQLKELQESFSLKSTALKKMEAELKTLTTTCTTTEAKRQINEKKENIEILSRKLDSLKGSTNVISAEEKTAILSEHEKLFKEYR